MKAFWPILFVALAGCGKQSPFASDDSPPVYLGGFVCQINTEIPVPYADVYFLKYEPSDWLGPNSYSLLAKTQCDSLGKFEIPLDLDADEIRAVGREDQFETTIDASYPSYEVNGGLCRLPLTPKAWVKVKAVDVEPLNPEVNYVSALPPGGAIDRTNISDDWVIWFTPGNIQCGVYYRFEYQDGTFGSPGISNFIASGLDTTEVIITY